MSLRIVNASTEAFGEVPFDSGNRAIYPVTYGAGGNLALPASCAIIIRILEEMQNIRGNFGVNVTAGKSPIRLREIH